MLILANYADEKNECFPSIKTLARNTRMSERQMVRIIARLEKLGEIVKVTAGGGRKSNRYRILLLPTPEKGPNPVISDRSDIMSSPVIRDSPAVTKVRQGSPAVMVAHESSSNRDRTEISTCGSNDFPKEWMNDPKFVEAWRAFLAVRRKRKLPNTPFALAHIGKSLTAFGKERSIFALTKSAVSAWPDVYPPKESEFSAHKPKRKPWTPEQLKAWEEKQSKMPPPVWVKRQKPLEPSSSVKLLKQRLRLYSRNEFITAALKGKWVHDGCENIDSVREEEAQRILRNIDQFRDEVDALPEIGKVELSESVAGPQKLERPTKPRTANGE